MKQEKPCSSPENPVWAHFSRTSLQHWWPLPSQTFSFNWKPVWNWRNIQTREISYFWAQNDKFHLWCWVVGNIYKMNKLLHFGSSSNTSECTGFAGALSLVSHYFNCYFWWKIFYNRGKLSFPVSEDLSWIFGFLWVIWCSRSYIGICNYYQYLGLEILIIKLFFLPLHFQKIKRFSLKQC